jgi:hypothetical protein
VAFFWLGRDIGINLRENMFTFPLKSICSISIHEKDIKSNSCNNKKYITTKYENKTLIGDAIRNITVSIDPDLFIINIGHHTNYIWYAGFGRYQYESIN